MTRKDDLNRSQATLDSLAAAQKVSIQNYPQTFAPLSAGENMSLEAHAKQIISGITPWINVESEGHHAQSANRQSIDDLFSEITLTESDTAGMESAEFMIKDLIVRGHITAFPAPPNGGKTALFTHYSGVMAKNGTKVFYINVDSPPDALKRQVEHAKLCGYKVICPDAKNGKSVSDALDALRKLANCNERLDIVVIFIDTLKKFVAVLSKEAASSFYKLLRQLSAKGATICLLSHTNKYKDNDGNMIFEGTGDHRSDVDNMIYLQSAMDESTGILEVTTRPDKVRAKFEPRSFRIHTRNELRIEECAAPLSLFGPDEKIVLARANILLRHGSMNSTDLVKALLEHTPYARDKIRGMLFHLSQEKDSPLKTSRGPNNSLLYFLGS